MMGALGAAVLSAGWATGACASMVSPLPRLFALAWVLASLGGLATGAPSVLSALAALRALRRR